MRRVLAPTVLAMLLQAPGTFGQDVSPLTPMDVFDLEYAQDPQISPDGESVVYVRRFSDVMTDQHYANLWIVRWDGTNHRPLTTGKYLDEAPRWSPDGRRLAYISDRDGSTQIYMRWMDTGETSAVTHVVEPPSRIAWSPDGTQLAFAKRVSEAALTVGQMPTPPAGAEWAPPAKYTDKLIFRYDGVGEIPPGNMHFFVVPAEGGTPRQVTGGDKHYATGPVSWTPDGESIVFSADVSEGYEQYQRGDSEVYEISVMGGNLRQITDRRGPDAVPSVSPDGRYIAYVGYDDRLQGHHQTDLYVANRDGSGVRNISAHLDRGVQQQARGGGGSPQWAPDGRGVYAVYVDEGDAKLALFSLDDSHQVIAEDVGSGYMGYVGWGTHFSVAGDGRLAFAVTRPHVPGDVAVGALGREAKLLTAINADLLGARDLGEVEEVWWESSKDQRRIQGWILKPPGFDPAKKYPLILEIHGGPFAAYGDVFDVEKQLMAAGDYVVLYSNPRGSTSYGKEFGNLIHHAYPGDDFYDLNSGVDAVIKRGYVDEDNLFVTGGSGGGVLTAWMIGNTDRFNAALAFYPVINWYSFNLTADIAPNTTKYWFPGLPWDNVEHYEGRSLLSVVKNVTTPTLIMTGEEDWRTPMSESEQYYKALKLQGIESVLVRVPEEPHGIWDRPSHGMSKMTTLRGWFSKHKKQRSVS